MISKYGLVLICIVSLLAQSAFARDCERAKELYLQSKGVADPALMEEPLRQSLELCPSFQAAYLLGHSYQKQEKMDQALAAYDNAVGLATSDKARGLALGRSGQVLAARGKGFHAMSKLTQARELHPAAPVWMEEEMKRIELQQAEGVMSARSIGLAFSASRAQVLASSAVESGTRGFAVEAKVNIRVNFSLNSAQLTANGPEQLQQMGKALVAQLSTKGFEVVAAPESRKRFRIIGHTDEQGEEQYNQKLSERRARTVKQELERSFPQLSGQLTAEGRGEAELLYSGGSEDDHRLNRRVEFQIIGD